MIPRKKIPWLWIGVSSCSFALANMKVEMFGTGEIDWAHFRFAWVFFSVGLMGVIFSTVKSYHDQSGNAGQPGNPPLQAEITNEPGKPVPVVEKPIEPKS